MKTRLVFLIIAMVWVGGTSLEVDARRIHLTPEQKSQLAKAQTVLIEVLALTEKGAQEAGPLAATVQK